MLKKEELLLAVGAGKDVPETLAEAREKIRSGELKIGEIVLIKNGVPLKEVNLGGAGIRGERKPFINNVSLDPQEVLACEEMQKAGCRVYYQLVPEQGVQEIDAALKAAKQNFGL